MSIDDAALAERAASASGALLSAWTSKAARREAVRTGYGPLAVTAALADEAQLTGGEEELRAEG